MIWIKNSIFLSIYKFRWKADINLEVGIMSIGEAQGTPSAVFFSARLGGGHVTAKNAIKEELVEKNPRLDTSADIDITGNKVLNSVWLPFVGRLGDYGADAWNNAQKAGDLGYLRRFASLGWLGELLLYPIVYFRVKSLLQEMQNEPRFIISSQAFCLNAIANAVRTVNQQKKWNMHIDVYLTDLPSKKAIHFFPSIRRVSGNARLRDLVCLHSPKPMLKTGQTEEQFWRHHVGNVHVITTEHYPIRKAFLQTDALAEKLSKKSFDVSIRLNRPEEMHIIDCGIGVEKAAVPLEAPKSYTINVKKEDKVGFLMLGSQPTTESVLSWLRTFADASAEKAAGSHQHYLFLYCGAPDTPQAKNPLLESVYKELEKMRKAGHIPPHMHFVPFTNQDADQIALLMARSDLTITRSGGATSMELLQLHQAKDLPKRPNKCTLIHSEALTRTKDIALLKHLESSFERLVKNIDQQRGDEAALSGADWEHIATEMRGICQKLGIPREKVKSIVSQILSLYQRGGEHPHEFIQRLLRALEDSIATSSREGSARERKISSKIAHLRKKEAYKGVLEPELRKRAIEKLLVDEGIVLWESKNASYLERSMGAHVVNPEYAKPIVLDTFFQ
jgi:hypothetical protein